MEKNTYIETSKDDALPHLPMGRLFYLLHSNGFNVKPDDYLEMLKVTERFGSASIDDTAKWICPIIATSEIEQSRFYNVIEQYKTAELLQNCADKPVKNPIPLWFKLVMAAVLCGLLAVTIFLSARKNPWTMEETNKERTVEKGLPVLLDAADLLKDHPRDAAAVQFTWKFEDGAVVKGARVSHVFKDSGNFFIQRRFASSGRGLVKTSDSLLVHVCNDLPVLKLVPPEQAVITKKAITLTASVDARPGTISYYQWTINDSVTITSLPEISNVVFAKEGDYTVECKAVVGSVTAPCTAADNEVIQVFNKDLHYRVRFSAAKPGGYTGKARIRGWVTLLLLLPAASLLGYGIFRRKRKPAAAAKKAAASIPFKGPYDIPFEQNDTKLIQPEQDLRRMFTQMQYKAEEDVVALNINASIRSMIQSGGSPQLIFAPVAKQQQYLILIDRTNPKNMLMRFSAYVTKSMLEGSLPVAVFYYDATFTCSGEGHRVGLSLQRMADNWSHATLIILGKAHELVYPVYPVMEENLLKELNRWQNKVIVTPVPLGDWGQKEKVLQENVILVPADAAALQKMIPALREKTRLSTAQLSLVVPERPTIRNIDFRDADAISGYLGNDEVLFQWLCAICIYPRLKWELLVEIGKAILDKYGCPESLNYSSLLTLCRIPWMQQGVFPQATRFELLKRLHTENEICAREKLLHLLNYSTAVYPGGGHFFEEEKQRQVLTNQFILHASNKEHYNQFSSSKETFKKLWKNDNILDVPLKKYLDKSDTDNWETPVTDGSRSIGLSGYFNLPEIAITRKLQTKKLLAAAAALLLVTLWCLIAFGGTAFFAPLITTIPVQETAIVPVPLRIVKNFRRCGDSAKKYFDRLSGYLEINHQRYPMAYNAKRTTALFNVPGDALANGQAQLFFSWETGKSVETKINLADARMPDSVTIACLNTEAVTKQQLYLRFNDTAGYKSVQASLEDVLYRYNIDAEAAVFSDSSKIIYYESNQKARADSIVWAVKQKLNIDVREDFVPEKGAPSAIPILFLNTSTPAANTDNGNENAAYYHGIADDLFSKKQYQKAVDQYRLAIKLNPGDALAWYQIALCYEMMGNRYDQQAITAYNAAIIIKSDDGEYFYGRAGIYYNLENYTQAMADYNKAIALFGDAITPQSTSAVYLRGKSAFFLNNSRASCKDFKVAAGRGYAPAIKDYGTYCSIAGASSGNNNDSNKIKTAGDNNQQQQTDIPQISASQLSDMLTEVTQGKRTAADFSRYFRDKNIIVSYNNEAMGFTAMCSLLQSDISIESVKAQPTFGTTNQIIALVVTTTSKQPERWPASKKPGGSKSPVKH